MSPSALGQAGMEVTLAQGPVGTGKAAHRSAQAERGRALSFWRRSLIPRRRKAQGLTLFPHNLLHSVEESSVLGVGRGLVMDELHLREREAKELAPWCHGRGALGPLANRASKVRPGLWLQIFIWKQGQ